MAVDENDDGLYARDVDGPPTTCPRCGYVLQGLVFGHACLVEPGDPEWIGGEKE